MHIFIAGVMQGARLDDQIHEQDYRLSIARSLKDHIPEAQITDPWALNPNSVDYDEDRARETFLTMTAMAGEAEPNVETVVMHDVDIELLRRHKYTGTTQNWNDRRKDLYRVIYTTPEGKVEI